MGKYSKKSEETGGVATEEVNHAKASLGVRTRAMVLADLQRAQMISLSSAAASAAITGADEGGSYLQLRSRRVERLPPGGAKGKGRKQRKKKGKAPDSEEEESEKKVEIEPLRQANENEKKNKGVDDLVVDVDFSGENVLESETKERTTRESTAINLIKDSEPITPPGSRTKLPNNTSRIENLCLMQLNYIIPTIDELNELFADAEKKEHNKFIEKYNFDPVKEEPLPGRFEWEKMKP